MNSKKKTFRSPWKYLFDPQRGSQDRKNPGVNVEGPAAQSPGIDNYALSLLEQSFDLILVVDRAGKTLYLSPSVEGLLGYKREDILGQNAFDYIHLDDLQGVAGFYRKGVDRVGFSSYITFRVRHQDGSWHYFEAVGNNLLEDPLIEGIVVNARDITEQKRLADGLKEAEEQYHTMLDAANDAILIHDIYSGELMYINKKTVELYGYTLDEARLMGLEIFDRHQNPYTTRELLEYAKEAIEGKPQLYEWQPLDKTGKPLWVEVNQKRALIGGRNCILSVVRDITDRKNAEEALQQSRQYFQALIENTSDLIAVLDGEGKVRYISPSVEPLTGYLPEEMTGRNIFEITHPDDIQNSSDALAYAVKRPGITRYAEVRIQHKDGTWHHYEVSSSNLLDNPSVRGIVINARDTTERKLAEVALRESGEKYRLIYDYTGEAIFTYDRSLTLIGMNRKACEIIGYSENELQGRNVLELGIVHPDDLELAAANTTRLLEGEEIDVQLRFIRKDGSVILAELTSRVLLDRDGVVVAVTNVARDITERSNAEERLDKLNRCLLGLGHDPLENIKNIALTGKDALGGSLLCYLRMDKGRPYIFSSAREDEGFFKPSNPEKYACYQIISTDRSTPLIEKDITGTDLEEDPELAAGGFKSFLASPIRLRGKTVGCLGMFNREKGGFAQEEINFMGMLAQALTIEEQRLAHEESIRHFVDIASHELRTPLSIIKGYADAFQFGDLMDLNDFQLDKIRIINTKADKMTKTINDLLDLSRIERGNFTIDKQRVDLAALIKGAVRQMREKGSNNRFSIGALEDLEEVSADPEKVVDLLLILLDNATHYSPTASEISVEVEPRGNEVVISVMDRGWSVPEKDRETIFERFYQVEDLRHHSASGIGLGLYIAREIAEGHGGDIWYEPREGGGSIFSFSLPE